MKNMKITFLSIVACFVSAASFGLTVDQLDGSTPIVMAAGEGTGTVSIASYSVVTGLVNSTIGSVVPVVSNALETAEVALDAATNAVPMTRTINGKTLDSDITLSADDVAAIHQRGIIGVGGEYYTYPLIVGNPLVNGPRTYLGNGEFYIQYVGDHIGGSLYNKCLITLSPTGMVTQASDGTPNMFLWPDTTTLSPMVKRDELSATNSALSLMIESKPSYQSVTDSVSSVSASLISSHNTNDTSHTALFAGKANVEAVVTGEVVTASAGNRYFWSSGTNVVLSVDLVSGQVVNLAKLNNTATNSIAAIGAVGWEWTGGDMTNTIPAGKSMTFGFLVDAATGKTNAYATGVSK